MCSVVRYTVNAWEHAGRRAAEVVDTLQRYAASKERAGLDAALEHLRLLGLSVGGDLHFSAGAKFDFEKICAKGCSPL